MSFCLWYAKAKIGQFILEMDWSWSEMDISYPCLHLASVIDPMILLLHLDGFYRALHATGLATKTFKESNFMQQHFTKYFEIKCHF